MIVSDIISQYLYCCENIMIFYCDGRTILFNFSSQPSISITSPPIISGSITFNALNATTIGFIIYRWCRYTCDTTQVIDVACKKRL